MSSLDGETAISMPIRADMLLDMANLPEDKKLLIKSTVNNRRDFDEIADQLMKMFPKIHLNERSGRRTFSKGTGKGNDLSVKERVRARRAKPRYPAPKTGRVLEEAKERARRIPTIWYVPSTKK